MHLKNLILVCTSSESKVVCKTFVYAAGIGKLDNLLSAGIVYRDRYRFGIDWIGYNYQAVDTMCTAKKGIGRCLKAEEVC